MALILGRIELTLAAESVGHKESVTAHKRGKLMFTEGSTTFFIVFLHQLPQTVLFFACHTIPMISNHLLLGRHG